MIQDDPLVAPARSVPTRDGGPARLGDCWRRFREYGSPRLIGLALAVALGLRIARGNWGWRDAVLLAGVVAVTPFVEWMIHAYLLHARPFRIGARRIDLLAAREHRAHHMAPAVLDGVLIPPYAHIAFLPLIAATNYAVSFPIHAVLGGDRLAFALTGLIVSYAILFSYEWSHFLIHTPYRPRGRYYRAIWRNHRLHHYKNEHYWFGVTSIVGDRVIGTLPDQREVERSRTARTLH